MKKLNKINKTIGKNNKDSLPNPYELLKMPISFGKKQENSSDYKVCPICEGKGSIPEHKCSWCNGSGKRWFFFNCDECNGTGRIDEHECSYCDGSGKVDDFSKIRLKSQLSSSQNYRTLGPPPPNNFWWNYRNQGGADNNPNTPW